MHTNDVKVLRELARRYAEIAADPIQEQRRELWRKHLSLQKTPVPVCINTGYWDLWCRQTFADSTMQCADEFFREVEKELRLALFHYEWGDDMVQQPWITLRGVQQRGWKNLWGVEARHESLEKEGAAWRFDPVLKDLDDVAKLSWPQHQIDEAATAAQLQKLGDAVGDLITVNRERGPVCAGFMADICTHLAELRGLQQLMMDMLDAPEALHRLLAWMRDGILANQEAAEKAGDIGRTSQQNQCMCYGEGVLEPQANAHGAMRKDLWAFSAAQEFTGISPQMHEEFLLQYQKPIVEKWGLCAYGCCEDLTRKIEVLSRIRNLRIIAVTPRADVRQCAQQIGKKYVLSWRPNPADMVCCGFDEAKIRRVLKEGLEAARGCYVHLNLKDVYTLEGDTSRLARWMKVAREVTAEF